jgi:hypothetical protein
MPAKKKKVSPRALITGREIEPGTINLYTRPRVKNPDGSVSTVRTMGFSDEPGVEINVPTVGEHGGLLSDQDAIAQYYRTGQHLGKFTTAEAAEQAARALHDRFAQGLYDVPFATSRSSVDPDQLGAVLARFLQKGPTR